MIAVNRQPVNGTMGPTDKPIMDMINDPESYPLSLTFGKYVTHCDELLSDILRTFELDYMLYSSIFHHAIICLDMGIIYSNLH